MLHGPVSISIDRGAAGNEVEAMSIGLGTAGRETRARAWTGAGLIALAGAAAYANSFSGAFQFDDIPAILNNPSLRQLWPPWIPLEPPQGGMTVSGRPILNLTFALNHAISGDRLWSYHALNLLIHVGAALALLGIVGRTRHRLGRPDAQPVAVAVALLWVVHPLTTEAVTYIVQRAESLMALLYLLTLYGFVRAAEAGAPRAGITWSLASVTACWLGMGVKEVMVSAPVAVLLYDCLFVTGSWAGAWRARRGYYLALVASWLPLVFLVAGTGWDRSGTFVSGVSWGGYWLSQGEAIARYATLCVWPHPLAIEYGPPTAPLGLAWLLAAIVLAGAGIAVAACVRGRGWGFLPAICVLVLAPTSVMPGILQFAAEHRMYLPLAAVLTALVIGGRALVGDRGWPRGAWPVLLGLAVVALAATTVVRNRVYRDGLLLWSDNVAKKPASAVAQANVGECLLDRGRAAEAVAYCERAVALDPSKPIAHFNLGLAYEQTQRWAQALAEFSAALRLNSRLFPAGIKAGRMLSRLGRPAEAELALRQVAAAAPDLPEAHGDLGAALMRRGDRAGAMAEFERSLQLKPDQPEMEYNIGVCLAGGGNLEAAAGHFAGAVRMWPAYGDAQLNLGLSLARLGRVPEALAPLEAAVRLMPASARTHGTLATALDQVGRTGEAVAEFRRSLELDPGAAEAHYNFGNALIHAHEEAAARAEFEEALRRNPQLDAAREMLDRIAGAPVTP